MKPECYKCGRNPKVLGTTPSYKCYTPKCPFYKKQVRSFKREKESLLRDLKDLIDKYSTFTEKISPLHWRSCGTNFRLLKDIEGEVRYYEEITSKELEKTKNLLK